MLTFNPAAGGGTRVFAHEFVRALARTGELEYRVFVPPAASDAGQGLPTTVVQGLPTGRSRLGRVAGLSLALLTQWRVRAQLQPAQLEAVHFPLSVMVPRLAGVPATTTIHDLQHETHPQFFSRLQLSYRRRVYAAAIAGSRIVATDSEYARQTLLEHYALEPARVRTIHLAVDHERFTPGDRAREQFLLYPANRWPHKNHERLFRAFALVRRTRPELRLVLTGAGHEQEQGPPGVESRGVVSADELVALYRTAAAVVFPSLYEGFGMPPLEAMACGCPVAVSAIASLPEICGDAAVYFDPTSIEDIARGIEEALDRPRPGGVEQAARFTWEACARRYEAVYRELARDNV